LIDYNDGSSFKYTIYERSVGDTSVQWIGISPDYLVTNDGDKDDQLDFAKRL
jgi:C-terminal processing protease CtpA/Prc